MSNYYYYLYYIIICIYVYVCVFVSILLEDRIGLIIVLQNMWLILYGTIYDEMHSHTLLINGNHLIRTYFLAMFKDRFPNDTNPTLRLQYMATTDTYLRTII